MTTALTPALSPGNTFELVRPDSRRGRFRVVVFDFDGTLSLVRGGWAKVMVGMMVPVLRAAGARESEEALSQHVEEFVMRLNGRPPIYQMMHLAEEVQQRGGSPRDPREYQREYAARLHEQTHPRLAQLRADPTARERLTVPGTHAFLMCLREKGLALYLASGTDSSSVCEETDLLGLTEFFGERIYAPRGSEPGFSKREALAQILRAEGCVGGELLSFGDGVVETEEVRRMDGTAVGVASEEVQREGVDATKRQRLIQAGADLIISDYRQPQPLLEFLFGQTAV